jgi:4-hydroxy-3-polyprenylbenzoate decarboxylase
VSYQDLREFLARLEREGELKRISAEVDVDLEITEITDRVSKAGGPALLFEKPRSARDGVSYAMPLLINTLGTRRRLEMALDVASLDDVTRRMEDLLDMKPPEGFFDKVKMLPKLSELGSFFPKNVRSGPVKEVIERENLSLGAPADYAVLAAGWRAIHHLSDGGDAQPQERPPQRGVLPHAGV